MCKMLAHNNKTYIAALAALLIILSRAPAWGAVGCDLNDPDRDVARLFPGSTRYTTFTVSIQEVGGQKLLARIEAKLRRKLRGLYETIDVPYTVYQIYDRNRKIGYIHGVNQKGRYGGIQIFLALDLEGRIKTFYIQKMSAPYAGRMRSADFARQFAGLSLHDFEQYDVATGRAQGRVSGVKKPASNAEYDFRAVLRGVKKNLLLMNEFINASPDL